VIEHLSSKYEAINLNTSTARKNKTKNIKKQKIRTLIFLKNRIQKLPSELGCRKNLEGGQGLSLS
jgi:hypothetical protein